MSSCANTESDIMDMIAGLSGEMMTTNRRQLLILLLSLTLLDSCSKINLSGGKGGNTASTVTTGTTGSSPTQSAQSSPSLDGEWEVDYEFKGNPFMGNVQFSQQGSALAGQGVDQDGKEWTVDAGQIQGTQISFGKKYAGSGNPPITYTGELKYLQSPEYTGWAMEGTYTCPGPNGQNVTGKWVANPTSPAQPAPDQSSQAQDPSQSPTPFFSANPIQAAATPRSTAPDHIGDVKPQDISGHYEVGYQYNFKKIKSKMWLENDGKKVIGHGYDIVERAAKDKKGKKETVREEFVIEKGWYDYPRVTLVRMYKDRRSIIFKAQLSSNGHEIAMKGETQFGGIWDARNISVVPGSR